MDWAELKNKGESELKELLAQTRRELHESRTLARARQLKQVHKIGELKKTAARINMLLCKKPL
ncbi:50S ribosomal protein L29 [Patescibacteria group bacterium]|nr:MAG: 50S ribosomal protein L29 [Patescibacteria group bacterium]